MTAVAIIGMAGRFPRATDLEEFWANLCAGREAITSLTLDEIRRSGTVSERLLQDSGYVRARGILEDVDMFDAAFFSISQRDAERMDPQVRVFLETAWVAIENAGYNPLHTRGAVGVYAGSGVNSYERYNLAANSRMLDSSEGLDLSAGGSQFLTMRVSHKLDLEGPSIQVDTACSTSLVAVVQACQALLGGHCDMALAGGVNVFAPQEVGYLYREGEITSPDGHCRPFDVAAQGMVPSEGVGVVVLKPLDAALRDGDPIHAVIVGTGLNNNGANKIGFTAPSVDGQAEAIAAAHSAGGIDPATIGYVECHGTATQLGDRVEIAALTQAFRLRTDRAGFCAVGSVKSNIGHPNSAAGIAGLIKTTLALEREAIPPSLHFKEPSPEIDFKSSPFFVNTELRPWSRGCAGEPRRAAVSSFGVGGTNAHVVVEAAPATPTAAPARPHELLVLAAKTETALDAMAARLAVHLRVHPEQNFADVAWTTQVGRTPFRHRLALVAADAEEAAEILEAGDSSRVFRGIQRVEAAPVVFLFPGQGAQYVNMGRALYEGEPLFRAEVNTCCTLLQPHLGLDLRELLFPEGPREEHSTRLGQTWLTQPAIFVVEYSLAKLWMAWGVRPQAMLGHSIGEYVAACLAGVFSLPDALRLVAARGQLVQELPEGRMLAVPLPEEEALALLEAESQELSLSAVNGPSSCVIGGPSAAVAALAEKLAARRVPSQRLRVSRAFHSSMMDSIVEPFAALVQQVQLSPAKLECVSTVTGTSLPAEDWANPEYWVRNLRQPVRFSAAVQEVLADGRPVLLEVGPGQTLTAVVKQHVREAEGCTVLASMHHPRDPQPELPYLLSSLARLWVAGVTIDWRGFAGEGRRRVALPTYPFERKRHWIDPAPAAALPPAMMRKPRTTDWFYVPSWQRTGAARVSAAPAARSWLIFADDVGVAAKLTERWRAECPVVEVRAGASFQRLDEYTYELRPGAREDYDALLRDLAARDAVPDRVLHLWGVVDLPQLDPLDTHHVLEDRCFYSLLWFGQALAEHAPEARLQLEVVTNDLFAVTAGAESAQPVRATVLGPCRVLPVELPGLRCRLTDFALEEGDAALAQLEAEWNASADDSVVAYRGGYRWVLTCAPLRLDRPAVEMPWTRSGGAYLITGGVGAVGLAIAELLAETPGIKLVLVARRALPAPAAWESWVTEHGEHDGTSQRIRRLQALERAGVELQVEAADISDAEAMRAVLARARARFGELRGVVHAAGRATGGMVAVRTKEGAAEVLAPKVKGTLVLQSLLRDDPLDFMVLCSSLASVLPGIGTIDYTGANAFLDAFAQQCDAHPWPVLAINWDVWSQAGMAVDAEAFHGAAAEHEATLRNGLRDDDGREVFARALTSGEPQVLVSTLDLLARLHNDQVIGAATPDDAPAAASGDRSERHAPSAAPRTDIEHAISVVVQDALGVASVGLHDNFFDLGLDSLIGHRVIAKLKKQHGILLSLRALLEAPSVADVAALVQILAHASVPAPVPASEPPTAPEEPHPLLEAPREEDGARHVWTSVLGPATHWLLDEHRLGGRSLLVFSTYLELARAAFAQLVATELAGDMAIELRQVYFVNPLAMDDDAVCAVRTVLTRSNGVADFTVETRSDADGALEHAAGQLAVVNAGRAPRHDLGDLQARYTEREVAGSSEVVEGRGSTLEFGPHWDCARRTWSRRGARLTFVELDPVLAAQDSGFGLHPALLDIAVGYGAELDEGELPFRCDRVLVRGPMPNRFYSLSEKRSSDSPSERVFDVAVIDESGTEVVRIEGYTLRKAARTAPAASQTLPPEAANTTLVITTPGLLEELAFARTQRATPGTGEVEIEVGVTGVNFKDVLYALGMMPSPNGAKPNLGMECAGTIVRVGKGVTAFASGDEVVALASPCFSAYRTVAATSVAVCPAGLSPAAAATIPISYLTAYHALVAQGRLHRGEKVLIHAAAGGVGLAAVKIAQWIGAEVFATAGSERKRDFLRSLGIEHVMNSRTLEFADEVMARTGGKGVDVVLNSLAGAYIAKGLSVLAPYGRFLELGVQDIHSDTPVGLRSFEKHLSFSAVMVSPDMPTFDAEWRELMQHFEDGTFQALPHEVFAAQDVAAAFQYMADAKHIGKVVVEMGGERALSLGA